MRFQNATMEAILRFIRFSILTLIGFLFPFTCFGDLVNPLLDQANGIFTGLDVSIAAQQNIYFSTNGRYFQGLFTSSEIPADGADVVPNGGTNPHDQGDTWNDFGLSLPGQMKIRMRCDTYVVGGAHGFIVIGEVRQAGILYRRAENHGPSSEDRKAHNWIEVIEE